MDHVTEHIYHLGCICPGPSPEQGVGEKEVEREKKSEREIEREQERAGEREGGGK